MLKLLEKVIKKDPFKSIWDGVASEETFSQAVHLFQNINAVKQKEISQKAYLKLQKKSSKQSILSTLIFLDFISTTNPEFCTNFPNELFMMIQQRSKNFYNPLIHEEKQRLSFYNYILFYLQFLRKKISPQTQYEGINSLTAGMQYFENSIQCVRLCFKYDFVINYCLSKFQNHKLFKISTENILRRINEDIEALIKFVNKWNHVIFQENDKSFKMNWIYEQLIYISKYVSKIEVFARKISLNISFPTYQIDKQLNKNIESTMKKRSEDRLKFVSERNRKTEKLDQSMEFQIHKIQVKSKPSSLQEEDHTQAQINFKGKKMI